MIEEKQGFLFVTCGRALEPLLLAELQALGIGSLRLGYRGVSIEEWNWTTVYRINYGSRIATRVLLPLARFQSFDQDSLYKGTYKVDWGPFFPSKELTFAIDANVNHPKLKNSLFAAQIVKDAICDQIREKRNWRPSINVKNPDIQLNLYIQHHSTILSFDTSGDPLHKRGYRQETVEAPMRETLAAALLFLAEYKPENIFLDPCCGSGTLLIEAALMASRTPPGYLRKRWGFMKHPSFQEKEWFSVKNALDQQRIPLPSRHLFGIDLGKNAVRASKINFKAAGFAREIEVEQADFREYTPPILPDFVLTNPPYGKRMEEENQLRPLYRALGDFLKQKTAKPSKGFIFTGNLDLAKEVGLAAKKRHVLYNGPIESRLLEFEIY